MAARRATPKPVEPASAPPVAVAAPLAPNPAKPKRAGKTNPEAKPTKPVGPTATKKRTAKAAPVPAAVPPVAVKAKEAAKRGRGRPKFDKAKYDWSKAFELYCHGQSYDDIARALGCAKSRISAVASAEQWKDRRREAQQKALDDAGVDLKVPEGEDDIRDLLQRKTLEVVVQTGKGGSDEVLATRALTLQRAASVLEKLGVIRNASPNDGAFPTVTATGAIHREVVGRDAVAGVN
jgi:hypothetical protein